MSKLFLITILLCFSCSSELSRLTEQEYKDLSSREREKLADVNLLYHGEAKASLCIAENQDGTRKYKSIDLKDAEIFFKDQSSKDLVFITVDKNISLEQ